MGGGGWGGRAGGLAGELGNGRGFGRAAKRRALPMPPTAQEMASELHAWRPAAARSRSTAKGGTAGLGSPARAVTARCQAPPSVSESRRSRQQGWAGQRSQRHPAGCQTRGSVAAASLSGGASRLQSVLRLLTHAETRGPRVSTSGARNLPGFAGALPAASQFPPEGEASLRSSPFALAPRGPPFQRSGHLPAPLLPPQFGI